MASRLMQERGQCDSLLEYARITIAVWVQEVLGLCQVNQQDPLERGNRESADAERMFTHGMDRQLSTTTNIYQPLNALGGLG